MEEPSETPPPLRSKRSPKVVLTIVGILLFLVIAVLVSPALAVEAPFRITFGWMVFLRKTVGEMTLEWGRIGAGLGGLILATAGMQFLASGWRRFSSPESPRWRWRWSAAITLTMVAMSAAALSVAGMAHQIAWMKGEPMLEYGFMKLKPVRDAGNVAYLISDFAEKNEGKFPDDLFELVSWVFGAKAHERDTSNLLFFTAEQSATPEPWLYFGRGLTDEVPTETILLASPRSQGGLRLIVTADGKVNDIPEEEFQNKLSTQERQ